MNEKAKQLILSSSREDFYIGIELIKDITWKELENLIEKYTILTDGISFNVKGNFENFDNLYYQISDEVLIYRNGKLIFRNLHANSHNKEIEIIKI